MDLTTATSIDVNTLYLREWYKYTFVLVSEFMTQSIVNVWMTQSIVNVWMNI